MSENFEMKRNIGVDDVKMYKKPPLVQFYTHAAII